MGSVPDDVYRFGPNPEKTKKRILRRDDYTCLRCGHKSGPHAGDDGRVLQVHHINPKSEGGSNKDENLITLCRPCHGVQHPKNDSFDSVRGHAAVYPPANAADPVAYVNSKREGETWEEFFERKDKGNCRRCESPPDDGEDLFLYPNVQFDSTDELENPGEDFAAVCGPCLGLVFSDHRNREWARENLYTITGDPVEDGVLEDMETRDEEALISGTRKKAAFGATREAVNRKERFLFKSPYRLVHWLWRRLGTIAIAYILYQILDLFFYPPILEAFQSAFPNVDPSTAEGVLTGAAVVYVVAMAFLIRWSIAWLSDRIWERIDEERQPHHFQKDIGHALGRRMLLVGKYLMLPYLIMAAIVIWAA